MSTQQPEPVEEILESELPHAEIEATGGLSDGVIRVKLKLGEAQVKLRWPAGSETDDIDTLIGAILPATAQVLDAIVEAQSRG